ncbi:MAG: hypothetical protein ACKVH8_21850 [Pirellulales bacterium]
MNLSSDTAITQIERSVASPLQGARASSDLPPVRGLAPLSRDSVTELMAKY